MRILLDTNILIPLEDSSKTLHDSFSEFVRLAHSNEHCLLVHPSSRDDIERDRDKTRREISLSRFKKYSLLSPPPAPPTDDELASYNLSEANENDRVDNEILFSIFRNAANILVSEDRGLHRKASRMGLSNRVHYLQQAVEFLRRIHAVTPISLPNIEEVPLYQIDVNVPFFDSLREDYDFNKWYQEKAREGRRAWIHKDVLGKIGAVCIFHIENDPILTNDHQGIPGKVLKLCTFKVGESVRGRRVGELFFKAAFRYAFENEIEHIYLHTRAEKQEFLIDFCREFGFFYFGEYKNDAVYVKEHPHQPPIGINADPVEYHRKYFPHFMAGKVITKYIVPIQPKYHEILFPDGQIQLDIFRFGNVGTGQVAGNAIRQAYLCHARIGGITPGDVLLFYRSKDQKSITSVGVIEKVGDYNRFDDIVQLVSKRTVYSHGEIHEMAKKKTKVILFRLVQHLSGPIPFNWLKKKGVVKGPIQTIRRIKDESFIEIIRKGRIKNCLLAD